MVHIISTELEIPLTAVTVQSSVSGSPIVTLLSVSFSSVSLSNTVICTNGIGTVKCMQNNKLAIYIYLNIYVLATYVLHS